MSTTVSAQLIPTDHALQRGADITARLALVPPADHRLIELIHASKGVPCFICSPHRTGRTSLALNYARRQYAMDEVLWLDAAVEGFSEAVGKGTMLEHLERQITNNLGLYRLVIIDDLPLLDDRQASHVSDWIDQLIEDGLEVMLITTPQEDCLQDHQSDRLMIEGNKLVKSQKWPKERMIDCLTRFFSEDISHDTRVLAALMIAMGRGLVDTLRELGYTIDANAQSLVKRYCPLIEVDEATGYFDARGIPLQALSSFLIEGIEQAARGASDQEMSVLERSFERLTQLSVYLYEHENSPQSQVLLELAGSLLSTDDAGFPLVTDSSQTLSLEQESPNKGVTVSLVRTLDKAPVYDQRSDKHQSLYDQEDQLIGSEGPDQLVIRLFGDFKVLKGGKHIEGKQLQRSKVRILLIHLALNMGRGVSRDFLLERIWPEKDFSHAKDNFYSTWSMLNSILSGKSKTSPYLSNKQGLCKLDSRYVLTDVYEFERLSKAVLFQQGSVQERKDAIFRLEQLYRGDIMSGTRIDGYIQAAQTRYRAILVDVMIEASKLFSQEGNDTNAVWFARQAYDTDPTREDVYRTLMAMQDKAGQRTSALKTYFDCKRFLSEELGILPSQKTIELYQELVLDRR